MRNLKITSIVLFCLIMLFPAMAARAQNAATSGDIAGAQPQASIEIPKLSPGAAEVARELGLMTTLEKFYSLPENERGGGGRPMSPEALALREQILETLLSASLEVDGVTSEIDDEIAKSDELRSILESKRDHAVNVNNVINFISGGLLNAAGSILQYTRYSQSTNDLGNTLGV